MKHKKLVCLLLVALSALFLISCAKTQATPAASPEITATAPPVAEAPVAAPVTEVASVTASTPVAAPTTTPAAAKEVPPTPAPAAAAPQVQDVPHAQDVRPPSESEETKPDKNKKLYCTFSISCETILANKDRLKPEKAEIIPENGQILAPKQAEFYEGESVFNLLQRETKRNKIHMEFTSVPVYGSKYIEGIQNIYEFDCGELSGWMYRVNGLFPGYGCSRYLLKEGDTVEILYTCDLGRDVGDGENIYERQKQ